MRPRGDVSVLTLGVMITFALPAGAQDRAPFDPPNPSPVAQTSLASPAAPLSLAAPPPSAASQMRFRAPNPAQRPAQAAIDAALSPSGPAAAATVRSPEPSTCFAALAAAGARFERRGRHDGPGACGIDDAVSVSAVGAVDLQPDALLSCPTALTFAQFMNDMVDPLARAHLSAVPVRAYVAASYACRGRNNVPGARLSEHSFGRAIDIRAMDFAVDTAGNVGQSWSVRPRGGSNAPQARFQAALREAACGPFTTVLGPGSDGHHTDHLHLDTAQRSWRFCR